MIGRPRRPLPALLVLLALLVAGSWLLFRDAGPKGAPRDAEQLLRRSEADPRAPGGLPAPSANLPAPAVPPAAPIPATAEPDAAPSLRVRVEDERGVPLASVATGAFAEPDTGNWCTGRTDAGGWATLDCPPGKHWVSANTSGAVAPYGAAHLLVDVPASSTLEVTLRLPDVSARLDVLVQDDRGVPLAGVVLDANGGAAAVHDGERTTDERGVATWEPIVDGTWSVAVESAGAAHVFYDRRREQVNVHRGETKRHTLVLPRKGRVVVHRAEIPHVEALVGLELTTEDDSERRRAPWRDELIAFEAAPGPALLRVEWSGDVDGWTRPQLLEVLPGEDTIVRIAVEPGPVALTGRVVDAAGVPVEGVSLYASVRDDSPEAVRGVVDLQRLAGKKATSDAAGSFALRGLPRGRCSLSVSVGSAQGRHLADYGSETGRHRGFTVEDPTQPLELVVVPGVVVEGRVNEPWATRWVAGDLELRIVQEQPSGPVRYHRLEPRPREDGSFVLGNRSPGLYSAVMREDSEEVTAPFTFVIPHGLDEGSVRSVELVFAPR